MQIDFMQVAFAGHNRSEDLGDVRAASQGLAAAFALLAEVGVTKARLLTGLAPGADVLAAEAWRTRALGPVHAIFPFLDETPAESMWGWVDSATWLDGEEAEGLGRNPHLAQTRWLVGTADLLVVVWTGERARGAGGTADAVRLALQHGLPVIWIKTNTGGGLRLIRPEHVDEDFGFLEFLEGLKNGREPLVTEATAASVSQALELRGLVVQPPEPPPPPDGLQVFTRFSRAYALFRRTLGGTVPPFISKTAPEDLARQDGFVRLTAAQGEADAEASRLGAIHRSQQVILLAFAILGAAVGSLSVVWPNVDLPTAGAELVLTVGVLMIWHDSERHRRHELWSGARRLAEDLRLERVAWSLGVSTISYKGEFLGGASARRLRRLAGLPEGRFDRNRVKGWGGWAVDELIAGQSAYHRSQTVINGRILHRIHQFENVSFFGLLFILIAYFLFALGEAFQRAETPMWAGGVVVMASTIVPTIGAAILALDSTLAISEQARRSEHLAKRLQTILDDVGPNPSLEDLRAAIRTAVRLARAQEDLWLEGASQRRMSRGV